MKTIKLTILTALSVLSTLSCILLSGCNTIKAIPLAYSENEEKEVAYVYFDLYKKSEISGATFITYDNKNTPKAEKFTYYSPVELPAGVPIKMYLHVYYKEPRSDFGDKSCIAACCTTYFFCSFPDTAAPFFSRIFPSSFFASRIKSSQEE